MRVARRGRRLRARNPARRTASGAATEATSGSTRYAPLDQINAENFSKLTVAWRFKTDSLGPRPEFKLEATPLMVHGVLYSTAARGATSWRSMPPRANCSGCIAKMKARAARMRRGSFPDTGLAYWTDGKEERILYVTPGYRLIALDAKTGVPVPGFGKNGVVDLKQDDDQEIDLVTGEVGLHSTPVVAKNVVIVGAAHLTGSDPHSRKNVKGYVRGFDVRTGKRLWIFHTIPRPGEYGIDTWERDSWSYTGNTGVWGQISVDEDLGLVYLPVELPTGDYYGGDRPGAGLFGESIVAVDLQTGKRKWHYQLVHHGMWDMDIPCAPILVDITINGRTVKALAQPTKQAFLYVFNRETGEPIWPIEERPVPKGDVPGEWYSPTQPFPTKPPAYDNQGVSVRQPDRFHAGAARRGGEGWCRNTGLGRLFTPPSVSKADGPLGPLPRRVRSAERTGRADRTIRKLISCTCFRKARSRCSGWSRRPGRHFRIWNMCRARRGWSPAPQQPGRRSSGAQSSRERRRRRWRRWRTDSDRARFAAVEAALRAHHRVRHGQGRNRLAGGAWRDAG